MVKKKLHICINAGESGSLCKSIFKVGLAPFRLTLTPNISLVIINRFSASYGDEKAIAAYACISYIIRIIYMILQGVADGSQPLMSKYYGEKRTDDLAEVKRMAYIFAVADIHWSQTLVHVYSPSAFTLSILLCIFLS